MLMTRLTAIMAIMWQMKMGVLQAQTETGNCPSDPSVYPSMMGTVHSPNIGTTSVLIPGHDMLLAKFCPAHHLTDGVHNKLEENGYSGSHTFQYAQWEELWEVAWKAGEIMQLWCGPSFKRLDSMFYRCLWIWYICYGCYGARTLYIFVMDITDRTLYIYILPLMKIIHISESRSTLHERNTLLHPSVLLHPLQLGHQREFCHQERTDHSYGGSRLLSWILPPQLGLDLESMGARKWCKHLQKESVSKTTWSVPICVPNLGKLQNIWPMVNVCIVHHQHTQLSWIW